LLDIQDLCSRNTNRSSALHGRRTSESHRSEVRKGNLGSARIEVLDDPLGIVLAERAQTGLVTEGVGDGLAGRVVGDLCRAAGLA